MSDIRRRLDKLRERARSGPEDERQRQEERERIRGQAEHANRCGWGKELGRWPLFEIDGATGDVVCTYDGRTVTDSRQILAELFYWMELEWGGPGLIHYEEAEAFYTPGGERALSRDRVDLRHVFSEMGRPGREIEGQRGEA